MVTYDANNRTIKTRRKRSFFFAFIYSNIFSAFKSVEIHCLRIIKWYPTHRKVDISSKAYTKYNMP